MKKFFASALFFAAISTQASASDNDLLRAGVERVKAKIDAKIEAMGGTVNEFDLPLVNFLLKSSNAFENTIDFLDLSDAGLAASDIDAYVNNFALACNRVAAARAQLGNAGRRARLIGSVDPTPDFLATQVVDITDTRDSAGCPH